MPVFSNSPGLCFRGIEPPRYQSFSTPPAFAITLGAGARRDSRRISSALELAARPPRPALPSGGRPAACSCCWRRRRSRFQVALRAEQVWLQFERRLGEFSRLRSHGSLARTGQSRSAVQTGPASFRSRWRVLVLHHGKPAISESATIHPEPSKGRSRHRAVPLCATNGSHGAEPPLVERCEQPVVLHHLGVGRTGKTRMRTARMYNRP